MYLIVGLGNPEEDYKETRHNMGFDTINKLAEQYHIEITKNKFKGLYGTGTIENEKVIDIEPGNIKIRKTGGPGTHNGMKSVIQNLKTKDFPRIRVGIGMPEHKADLINYVIGHVPEQEKKILDKATTLAKDAIVEIIKSGIDHAMNQLN